jgi:flagellar motor switch protein FliN/FliY
MMKLGYLKRATVPLEVVLGRVDVAVEELAGIREGTIIELDALAGEPVSIIAAGEAVAMGEVVVIDENFGVRVTEVLTEED